MARLSRNARDFVRALLAKNPAKRKRVSELLHHPWLIQHHANFCQENAQAVDPRMLDRITAVTKINAFGIKLLKILVTFFPPPKDFDVAVSAFFNADYSLTGFVTSKGLIRFFSDHGRELTEANAQAIVASFAFYEEGFLTFTEFLVAAIDRSGWIIGQGLVPQIFSFLDVDNSSIVTVDDLVELFRRFGYQTEQVQIRELIGFMGEEVLERGFDLCTFEKFMHNSLLV